MLTVQRQKYKGIDRVVSPDWLGWVILDLLDNDHLESDGNRAEIKLQLLYEVRSFYRQQKRIKQTN